ncbi:hypothetical protein AWB81_03847 [Caballeronia arationis]|jgi:hypothetical protein|uniref:Uncharacterized protein n=1 Tax=Caballeronia arationis TaxID=1777142 RepID=A0A7Z7I4M3_9BURK|nr:hypothetical protein AWB81_03847 [Caballeronia arationis]SOE59851.1 hypothetical protein SAMN05446927_1834 [Caballeronia arationis]
MHCAPRIRPSRTRAFGQGSGAMHTLPATCAGRYPGLRPHFVRLPARCLAVAVKRMRGRLSRRSRTVAGTAQIGTWQKLLCSCFPFDYAGLDEPRMSTRRGPKITQEGRCKGRPFLTLVRLQPRLARILVLARVALRARLNGKQEASGPPRIVANLRCPRNGKRKPHVAHRIDASRAAMPASVHVRSPHLHCSTARLSCPLRAGR